MGFARDLSDILAAFFILKVSCRVDRARSTTGYSDLQSLFLAARYGWGEGVIVEVGSYHGRSAIALAAGSKAAGREKVYCVDPHTEGTREIFLRNIAGAGVGEQCVPVAAVSEDAVRGFGHAVRLVFIDGDHRYESVKKDIAAWIPRVIDGGIIAFHDSNWPDVARAAAELLASGGFTREGISGCTLFISKGRRENGRLFAVIRLYNRLKNAMLLRGFRDA